MKIPFNLQKSGAYSGINLFLNSSDVINHGCWCSKLNPENAGNMKPDGTILGGCETVDEVDQICKLWIQTRKCISLPGGNCYMVERSDRETYQVEANNKSENPVDVCFENIDSCLKDACFIDQYFLNQLYNFRKTPTVNAGKETCCIGDTGFRGVPTETRSDPYCSGEVDYRNGNLNLKILHGMTTFPYTGSAYFPTSNKPTTIEPFTSLWPTGVY